MEHMTEMRFISNCPTHAAVWEVMEFEREGNGMFQRMHDAGQLFEDLNGQWWQVWISFFTTIEKAREYAGKSQPGTYFDVTVFDLS